MRCNAKRTSRITLINVRLVAIVILAAIAGSQIVAEAQGQPPPKATAVTAPELGQQLYARHCAACHGEEGDGRGVAAAYLFPKPRDFRAGRFRLVSTSNNVPSREDLHAVLLRGMPGSSMPPWGHLSQSEREALVDEVMRLRKLGARDSYVKFLKEQEGFTDEEIAAEDFQAEIQDYVTRFTKPGEPSKVPELSEASAESLARGKVLYTTQTCNQCHGETGKGDGQKKMVDDEGFPTAPRDFTLGIFKGGSDPASLYRRIAYGLPGTPMPSSSTMTPEQLVDLAHYVRSMSTDAARQRAVLKRETILAKSVDSIPQWPNTESWAAIKPVALRMAPLWWRDSPDPDLQVQTVHDGKTIALRLTWKDETPDRQALQSQAFEDAVAVELFRGTQEPFLGMGHTKEPVDVWFWDADRQAQLAVEDRYPNVVVDIYPFNEKQVEAASYQRPATQDRNQPDISLPAVASKNQIVPLGELGASSVTADGPGSVTFRIPRSQIVHANGEWAEGRWTVVMSRSLAVSSDAEGLSLEPGGYASVAFAIWDGSQRDRDGKKLITIWQDLVLEANE